MDADGNISDATYGEDRTTAEKHTSRTFNLEVKSMLALTGCIL